MVDAGLGLAVLVAVLGVFVVIGVRERRRVTDVEDFVVARGSASAGTLGLSFLAAGMGAWVLFAPPEVGAAVGLVAVVGYAVGAAAPLAVLGVLGARLRQVVPAGHSLTEFVRIRFGRTVHAYVIAVSIGYMLLFVTAELTAAAAVTGIVAGLDATLTVVAVAVATLAYTAVGGLPASLRTDRFQARLVMALLAIGAVALVAGVEDPAAAWRGSGLLRVDAVGLEVAATLVIAVVVANVFHQGYWQRVWAARDGRALRRGVALGAVAVLPFVLVLGAMGVLAAGAGLDLGSPPAPFFALLTGLPRWVGVVVLVLAVALVASSVDTLETGLASLVTAERRSGSLRSARLATVVLVLPAVVVAIQGFSVLRLFLIADLLCATVAVPALLGLWSRATSAGALAGAIAGLVGTVLPGLVATGSPAAALSAATFPGAVPTLPPFLGALVASAVVAVGVSLAARRRVDLEELGAQVRPFTPEPV